MIIALSLLAGWVLLSCLLSLLSGAVFRRVMETPQRIGRFHVSRNNDPEVLHLKDARFNWSSDKLPGLVDNPGQALEDTSAEKGSTRVRRFSFAEASAKNSSWCLPWSHLYLPSGRTIAFVKNNPTTSKWATFGSFCPGKVFFPRASFVFRVRVCH
jgi:hypothetical protein